MPTTNPLAGFHASVFVSTGISTATTNEAMTDVGGAHTTYQVTNAAHRYIDPTIAVVVQTSPDGTTWSTVTTGFTLQYCGGIVTFTVALTGTTPSCRLSSANWLTVSQAMQAKSIDLQVQMDIADVSTFAGGGWKQKLPLLAAATYKLSQWWVDTFYISQLGNIVVVAAYDGRNSNQRFEGYAYLKTDGIKMDVKSVVEESIDLESHGPLYYIAS